MAVAGQQTWTWVMPREWRGCIGCHEDREMVPPNRLAEAVAKPARRLEHPEGDRSCLSFVADIGPVLASRCGSPACHGSAESMPALGSDLPPQERYGRLVDDRAGRAPLVVSGSARASRLLLDLGDSGTDQMTHPMPLNELLTAEELRMVVEWIDLGALLEETSPTAAGGGSS
jgi:hypothetical protein